MIIDPKSSPNGHQNTPKRTPEKGKKYPEKKKRGVRGAALPDGVGGGRLARSARRRLSKLHGVLLFLAKVIPGLILGITYTLEMKV